MMVFPGFSFSSATYIFLHHGLKWQVPLGLIMTVVLLQQLTISSLSYGNGELIFYENFREKWRIKAVDCIGQWDEFGSSIRVFRLDSGKGVGILKALLFGRRKLLCFLAEAGVTVEMFGGDSSGPT